MRKKTASEIICQNFKIVPETIFQDYKCTYRSSVLFFGRLYIGQLHFLFIANMFGLVKKCAIKIDSIIRIDESQNSSNITIVETVDGNEVEYIFGSFKNSNAYQLMRALWKGQKIGSNVLKNQNEEENEEFNKLQTITGQAKHLMDEGQVEANFFNPRAVESQQQKIVQIQFPCSVEQFYNFFLADNANVYPRKKHLQIKGGKDIKQTQWRKSQQLNSEVREVTGTLKVTGVPFVKQAGMSQVWMLKREEEKLTLKVVTQMADVPYSAYFTCEQKISVTKDGDKKCKMEVLLAIVFNKSTYMKNTIMSRTQGDMKQDYEVNIQLTQIWMKNVSQILDQMRKTKDQSSADKHKVQVEYESNNDYCSQKKILCPPEVASTVKLGILSKISCLGKNLTTQQKIDIIFKLVILIAIMNLLAIFKILF